MVSVIIPVYNVKKYLAKCVDSVINQTLKDIEIILVDDGSTDGSGEVCDHYALLDRRVTVIHQKNAGQGAARNSGLDMAQGKWIGFVDSDDWLDENYYEKMVKSAEENDADMACCDRRVFDEQNNMIYEADIVEGKSCIIGDKEEYFYKYFFKYTPSSCNKLYRREIVKGIYFKSVKEVGSEDALFNYEILFRLNKISEAKGVFYNSLARENSTARSYRCGVLLQNYRMLEYTFLVAKRYEVSENTCLCMYNFFQQRTWNQLKVYGGGSKKLIQEEIKSIKDIPCRKEIASKMIHLKVLDKMGYRLTGRLTIKTMYFLWRINLMKLSSVYIDKIFIK